MTTVDPRPRVRPKPGCELGPNPPVPMEHVEKTRWRRAASNATRVLPGPVGELVSRELLTWEEFGYRLGDQGLVRRLVDDIERRMKEKES